MTAPSNVTLSSFAATTSPCVGADLTRTHVHSGLLGDRLLGRKRGRRGRERDTCVRAVSEAVMAGDGCAWKDPTFHQRIVFRTPRDLRHPDRPRGYKTVILSGEERSQ